MSKINFEEFESIEHELRFKEALEKNPNMNLKQKQNAYFKTSEIWQEHLRNKPQPPLIFSIIGNIFKSIFNK